MNPETWNVLTELAGKVWPVVVSLAGVFAGAWLARSWDRKKWQNDNRKQEYRELLTALTLATMALIDQYQGIFVLNAYDEQQATKDVYMQSLRIIQDRIFIAGDLERMKLFDRWGESVSALRKNKDVHQFEDTFELIKKEILMAATKY